MKKNTPEKWLKQGFAKYDWTDGIWHDGAEAGSQTNIIILPKAGIYVAVLTNTDLNSETAAQQLTQAVIEAPLPPSSPIPSPTPLPPTSPPQPKPTPVPGPNPTSALNPKSTPPTVNNGNCPGKAEFVFNLTTDEFPKETKWFLKRKNKVVKNRRYKTYKNRLLPMRNICVSPLPANTHSASTIDSEMEFAAKRETEVTRFPSTGMSKRR